MSTNHPLRLAIISTPRSGNTWLRNLLTRYYAIPTTCSHSLSPAEWAAMPAEVIHQIHWNRTPEFVQQLHDYNFRAISLARHPLDTLISILHFAWYDRETVNWLSGEGGDESLLCGAMPRSRSFIEYATGPRAAALLNVTCQWWKQPGVVWMRYEDIVLDPAGELARISAAFGPPRCESVDNVIRGCSLNHLRVDSLNNHFWKGQPGLWRQLLPAAEAAEIAAALAPICETLGYTCDADPNLTAAQADRNWVSMIGPELTQTLEKNTLGHRSQLLKSDERVTAMAGELAQLRSEAAAAELQRLDVVQRMEDLLVELQPYRRLEAFSVRMAHRIQNFRNRFPRFSGAFKSVARQIRR